MKWKGSYIALKNIGATTYVRIEGKNTTGNADGGQCEKQCNPKTIVFKYHK